MGFNYMPHLWVAPMMFWIVPMIILEIRHQLWSKKHIEFDRPLTTMNEEEFYAITRKGRRHLLLIDDLVVDATDYAPYHPGGQFIIERCRGTDISKFFYGGYNLEPKTNGVNYMHTNYAFLAVNSLIIAKLDRGVDSALVKIGDAHVCSGGNYRDIMTFKFVPVEGHGLSPLTWRHYPITWTGKHYKIQEVDAKGRHVGKTRHYTVSNCMAKDQYDDYCQALEAALESGKIVRRLNPDLYKEQASDNFSLTLKAYWDAEGMSKRLFLSAMNRDNGTFEVKGPMGKSLGVKMSGEHIAFGAGTGGITFMDLSAWCARLVLGELDEEESKLVAPDFKFTFYFTYFNEDQSQGLRMLKALDALCKSKGNTHFELRLRDSSAKSARWDQKFLAANLPATCEKLWICGTPVMNEVFEHAFHNLAPKFPYLKDLEVVQVL